MLKEEIKDDLNKAVKSKDEVACVTLRMLLAVILSKEKEKRYNISKEKPELNEKELNDKSSLTDEEITEAVSSEFKKRKEAILEYEKGDRKDLAEKERDEIKVLDKYMPEQLSHEEIKTLAQEAIGKVGVQDMKDIRTMPRSARQNLDLLKNKSYNLKLGKIMAELMPKIKGKADGSEVNKIIKEIICKN